MNEHVPGIDDLPDDYPVIVWVSNSNVRFQTTMEEMRKANALSKVMWEKMGYDNNTSD